MGEAEISRHYGEQSTYVAGLCRRTIHARADSSLTSSADENSDNGHLGESDRIVDVDYGRLYGNSIPKAKFEVISEAAHFPHIERLDEVVRLVNDFTAAL